MKIVYLVSTLQRTGPTRQLLNIVRCIRGSGCQPLVVTLSPDPADSLRDEFIKQGIEVIGLGMSRWATLQSAGPAVADFCRARSAEVVHSQGIRADTIAARFLSDRVTVATLRTVPWLDYKMTYGRLRGAVMSWAHLRALANVSQVVTVSRAVARELADKLSDVTVIQNGVDVDYYNPLEFDARESVCEELGIPKDATVFVSVGHLSERKDPETVLRAFEALQNNGEYALVMVGDGPLRARCESIAGKYARIIGRRTDVRPYLAAADVFVSASRAEGFPNAALEAAAMGLPLILSDIGPHAELGRAPGLDCVLFRTGEFSELSRQFASRAGFRNTLRSNRDVALSELNMKVTGERYLFLYKRLLASMSGRPAGRG